MRARLSLIHTEKHNISNDFTRVVRNRERLSRIGVFAIAFERGELARANNETGRILNSMARTRFLYSRRNTGNAVAHFGTGSRGIIQRQRFSRKSGVMKASVANRIGVDGQIISVSSAARERTRLSNPPTNCAIRQIRFVERTIIGRARLLLIYYFEGTRTRRCFEDSKISIYSSDQRESEVFARTNLIVLGCGGYRSPSWLDPVGKTLLTRYLRRETHKRKLKGCFGTGLGDDIFRCSGV